MADVFYFYTIGNYRTILWTCFFIPTVINLIMIVLFVKETPYFLLTRHETDKIVKDMNRIGYINKG